MKQDIYINGYIGDMFDFFGDGNSFSLRNLNETLDANATELTIHINSGGGLVSEGFAIYDKLISLNIPITTIVEGMCGSIATVIAQAGKTGARKMFQNSEYFIHNPLWIPSAPDAHTAEDLQKLTDELLKNEEKLVDFYAKVTGSDKTILSDKMKVETTLSASEAKSLGFIDEVISTDVVAMVKYRIAAAVQPIQKQKTNNTMAELKDEFAKGFQKIENLLAAVLKGKVVNATVKTTEGVDIYFGGTLGEGSKVFTDEAMSVPAPDGVHTYEGKLYTVTNGVVTKVEDVQAAQTPEEIAAAKVAELEATVVAKDAEIAAVTTEKAELIVSVAALKNEFVAFKQSIVTGGKEIFNVEGVDPKAGQAKQNLTTATLEYRKAKAERK